MKIVSQTADEIALKEGDLKGVSVGIVMVIVGVAVAAYAGFAPSPLLWVAVGVFLIGVAAILFSSSIAVDINKASGRIAYATKRLVGGSAKTFAVADVARIETRKSWRMENANAGRGTAMPRQVLVSQSFMVMKDGQEIPLDHQGGGAGVFVAGMPVGGGSGKEMAIANQVATFLGVPFQEIAPPGGPINVNIGGGAPGSGTGIQL